jgi:hypothetical protein
MAQFEVYFGICFPGWSEESHDKPVKIDERVALQLWNRRAKDEPGCSFRRHE